MIHRAQRYTHFLSTTLFLKHQQPEKVVCVCVCVCVCVSVHIRFFFFVFFTVDSLLHTLAPCALYNLSTWSRIPSHLRLPGSRGQCRRGGPRNVNAAGLAKCPPCSN